jgi:hypothetical protein
VVEEWPHIVVELVEVAEELCLGWVKEKWLEEEKLIIEEEVVEVGR